MKILRKKLHNTPHNEEMHLSRNVHKKTIAILGQKQSGKTTFLIHLMKLLFPPIVAIDCVGQLANYAEHQGNQFYIIETGKWDLPVWNFIQAIFKKKEKLVIDIHSMNQLEKVSFLNRMSQAITAKGFQRAIIAIDEIHEVLPQSQGARALDFERLIRIGGNSNIGFIFTTQRPQSLTKQVLALADTYVVFRIVYESDLFVVKKLLAHHLPNSAVVEQALREISGFKVGEHRIFSYV